MIELSDGNALTVYKSLFSFSFLLNSQFSFPFLFWFKKWFTVTVLNIYIEKERERERDAILTQKYTTNLNKKIHKIFLKTKKKNKSYKIIKF